MDIQLLPLADHDGGSKTIVFRPRLGLAFVANDAMARLATTSATTTPDALRQQHAAAAGFLEQIGFFEPDPPEPPADEGPMLPTTAVLLMTNQCQLRCRYCYAAAGEQPARQLSADIGRAAIDHVAANARTKGDAPFEVSFHGGGEPTRAWSVLCECSNHARTHQQPSHLTLTSNGVWSPAQCDWIMDHLDGVSLSIDGAPATQDRQRPLVNGAGSSPMVMRSVRAMDQRGFPYGMRMTATAPWDTLVDDVRFLCEETGCQHIQVEPAFNTNRGGHAEGTGDECRTFIETFLAALDVAERAGRRLQYSGARLGTVTTTFCRAPHQAVIVGADRVLTTCYEITDASHPLAGISTIGRIDEGEVKVDEAARSRLHHLMAERRRGCEGCSAYWSCAGDCYVRTFAEGEGGHLHHGTRCQMNRDLLQRLLLRGIAAGGGVWRSAGALAMAAAASNDAPPSNEPSC